MASNVNPEAITLHNKMVFDVSTEIFGETLEVVKEIFRDNPLNSADMSRIKNIPSLFKRLMDYETIRYGDYQKFVSTSWNIHPRVCSTIQEYSEKIKTLQGNLDDEGEETPSTEGNQTPGMSPLLLDNTDGPTGSSISGQGSLSPVSSLQAALDRLDDVFSDTQQVTVRRDHVFEDLMDLYKDSGVLQHRLWVTFAGESGEDAGGLTKDLFSTFWEQACSRLFTGEDVLVPHLPPHRFSQASTIYPVLGRILCHGLALTKGFPLQICRTVLISTALGQIAEDQKIILEDFLLFVSEHERALTRKGLDSFTSLTSDELSQLTNMFARFSMSVMPTQDNFRRHIENLAACELTGKPSFLCRLMRSGIPEIYKDVFFYQVTQGDLVSLCERLTPTPSRVIGLLKTENDLLRPEEERVLYFLNDFVYSLSSENLSRFLQFVTGSCVMPTSGGITVCFHHAQGLLRYPIGRTCGNVISLPIEYDTLQEFKKEFLRIISNDESFRMFVT